MSLKEELTDVVYTVVDSVNATLPDGKLDKSQDTVLFGEGGHLDSLGLVNFVVATEQAIGDKLGKPIALTDERAMSQRNSPFRTIGTLVDYIVTLANEPK